MIADVLPCKKVDHSFDETCLKRKMDKLMKEAPGHYAGNAENGGLVLPGQSVNTILFDIGKRLQEFDPHQSGDAERYIDEQLDRATDQLLADLDVMHHASSEERIAIHVRMTALREKVKERLGNLVRCLVCTWSPGSRATALIGFDMHVDRDGNVNAIEDEPSNGEASSDSGLLGYSARPQEEREAFAQGVVAIVKSEVAVRLSSQNIEEISRRTGFNAGMLDELSPSDRVDFLMSDRDQMLNHVARGIIAKILQSPEFENTPRVYKPLMLEEIERLFG